MKFFCVILGISAVIAFANGAALADGLYEGDLDVGNSDNVDVMKDDPILTRDRRFSCDLFSFKSQWLTPNHAVCAARCIATLHKGGSCVNGTCQCRKKWWQADNMDVMKDDPILIRDRRFSCDLFSFSSKWVTPNHAVCAARCISELHKGGSCVNGRCECREKWWQG